MTMSPGRAAALRSATTAAAIVALGLAAAAATGCRGATTRAAIRTKADKPVTVTLRSPDGAKSVTFNDVIPGATTEYLKLPFEKLKGIIVDVEGGDAKGGKVDLTVTGDNLITVVEDEEPATQAFENPDNEPFW